MSFRSQLLLVFALVAGIAFSFAFRSVFYNKPAAPTEQELKVAQEKQIPVMVAKGNLAVGEELTAQNIQFQRFPESRIPWNAIFHFQDADGRTLVKPVQDGRLISLFDLNDPDDEKTAEITFIPPGFQPTPVEIDAVRGENTNAALLKQYLHPQDKVSLSVIEEVKSQTPDADEEKPQRKLTTTPLFDEVEVYQVSSARKSAGEGNEVKKVMVVSLLFNDEQLRQVQKAVKSGNLLMTIQSKDNGTISIEGDLNPAASVNPVPANTSADAALSNPAPDLSNNPGSSVSEIETSAGNAPADNFPVNDFPVNNAPAGETLVQDALIQDAPAGENTASGESVSDNSAGSVSARGNSDAEVLSETAEPESPDKESALSDPLLPESSLPDSAERPEEKSKLPEGELKPVSNSSSDSEMLLDSPQEKKDDAKKSADDFVFTPRTPSADFLPIRAARKPDVKKDEPDK